MQRTLWLCGLSLLGLCAGSGASDADVIVRGPFGRPLVVVASPPSSPGVLVQVQQPLPPLGVQPPPPVPLQQPLPPGTIVSGPVLQPGVVVVPTRPLTHKEFAKVFQPLPGYYEVVLIHPGSHTPVKVCFTLPVGCPKVHVHHRDLVFDYGNCEVDIRFALHGKVRVTTR